MGNDVSDILQREGIEALAHMEEALRILDGCEGTLEIGAHLDLAICRLRELIERHAPRPAPEAFPDPRP